MIVTKRIYAPQEAENGSRFLVERLWPRGMKKESLVMDGWIRDAARRGNVTLLYSSRDEEHNNAVALKEYLEARLAKNTLENHSDEI